MPDDLAWETLESTLVYSCDGFDVRQDRVSLPTGVETDFDYVVENDTVVVVPLDEDGDLVMIEEWRQAVDHVALGFPAGGVEPTDEDLEAAARRELREETGHVADAIEPLVTVEPANGIASTVHHYWLARGCAPDADQQLDRDESIRVTSRELDELVAAITAGEILDARTVLGTLWSIQAGAVGSQGP